MKSIRRRLMMFLLAAALLCGQLIATALAVPPYRMDSGQAAAEQLYDLGLFLGTGTLSDGSPDFTLERTLNRAEAMALITRLLGGEQEAMAMRYPYPFQDVASWAAPYVGYVYHYGISNGTSQDGSTFGSKNEIPLNQFLTLVLRALGYSDVNYSNPYPTADAVGLYYPDPGVLEGGFYRADATAICLDAMDCVVRDQGVTLFEKLKRDGAVAAGQAAPAGVFVPGPVAPLVTELSVSNADDLVARLAAATVGHGAQITIAVPNGQTSSYIQRLGSIFKSLSSPFSEASGYSARYTQTTTIWFTPKYGDAARIMAWLEGRSEGLSAQDLRTFNAAKAVHASLVTPGMSEYDQVKAFHDWLVNHTEYDRGYGSLSDDDSSYDAAGVFLYGVAVCDGYCKALDLLCYLSGIECVRINGVANGGNHAWNKVKIDGRWYNIDVTWDDPISTRPILRYDYFLVSDSVLGRDHDWIAYAFWPDAPDSYSK